MAFDHQCRNPQPHPYYISGSISRARTPRFCWLCPEPILPGQLTARCRCGNGDGTFHVAHKDCALGHELNLARTGQPRPPQPEPAPAYQVDGVRAQVHTDPRGTKGSPRHVVWIEAARRDGVEVYRSANRDAAEGVADFLNAYPPLRHSLFVEGVKRQAS